MIVREFRDRLVALWDKSHEIAEHLPLHDYAAWSGATKDLLMALGLVWDHDLEEYVFRFDDKEKK